MWYCSECGKKNNGKFCTRCGTKYVEIDDDPPVFAGEKVSAFSPSIEEKSEGLETATVVADTTDYDSQPINAAALCRRMENKPSVSSERDFPVGAVTAESDGEVPAETGESVVLSEDSPESQESLKEPPVSVDRSFVMVEPEESGILSASETTVLSELPGLSVGNAEKEELTENGNVEASADVSAVESVDNNIIGEDDDIWVAPFLREKDEIPESENGTAEFIRRSPRQDDAFDADDRETVSEVAEVFSHRQPPESKSDKEWKYSKRLLISVGAVCGVVLLALVILIGSLFFHRDSGEEKMPESTGVYQYVSGVTETTPLYDKASIKSDVLATLENGDAVEFLEKTNAEFILAFDHESQQYGYVRSDYLVEDKNAVDYGNVDNQYDEEKSLGYYYVTKTKNHLTLWENPDGGGTVKAKLKNGYKVSLLKKTNEQYWYVFDYNSAERGYVRVAYLTDDKSKVVGIYREPKDKTVISDLYVVNVKQYLPIWSEPSSGSTFRGKLLNGEKVGLIQKTTGSFWYVYGYSNGVYGWVSTAYLAAEPEKKEEETAENYVVTGTQEYLPVISEPVFGGNEIAQIHNGDTVTILERTSDDFWYVSVPSLGIKGYVVKNYLKK